ncbi:DUF6541 family protein [Corynebacterium auris]|uniref:DUF6541 family protein n=1 Tax=Corynebacterium auris TaxID=44750 RepID=UPI0025B57173|nr:DUF6541 family protein [Corynebacterium auris]WJY67358.1 hypothetical protein CAURIS_02165 [Corynebacterium auris]
MALAGTVILALLVFVVPGFAFAWVAGARVPAALAAALPATFGLVGLSAWMWGVVNAPFTWLTFSITLLIGLAAAGLWRWAFARRARRRGEESWRAALWPTTGPRTGPSWGSVSWLLPAAGVVAGAWMIIGDRLNWLVRLPHGVGNIVQGWDSQWHANVVRFIMEEGVASPTRMGELQNMETHADLLYPSAYHAGIALFAEAAGLEPIPAVNIATTVLVGAALPVSMACLAFAVLRSRGLTAQIAGGLAAVAIYVAPPFWVADYVGMWPYLFATTMVGASLFLFCAVPFQRALALPAALAFVGVLQVHPSVVTYIALPVALFWLTGLLVRPARSRLTDLAWLAGPALAAVVVYLPQALAGSEQTEEVTGWNTSADSDITDAWSAVVGLATRHVGEFFPGFTAVTLLWLAGFGALVALFWRGQAWPVLFYALSVVTAVHAIEPFEGVGGDILSVIGGLHYNAAHRLVLPVAMLTVVGAAVGLAAMIRLVCLAPLAARSGSPRWQRASVAASVALALVAGAGVAWWARERAAEGAEASYSAVRVGGRMVSDDDLLAFDWLASQPAAWEGYTMGDPADGHSWIYAYNGVPTISRHYLWPTGGRGSSFDTLYWHADMLGNGLRGDPGAGNAVDRAARDLNVKFFLLSPDPFWREQFPNYEQLKGLWTAPGATAVYRKGSTVIFAVNEQFTRAELRALRNDATRSGSDPLPELEPAAPQP